MLCNVKVYSMPCAVSITLQLMPCPRSSSSAKLGKTPIRADIWLLVSLLSWLPSGGVQLTAAGLSNLGRFNHHPQEWRGSWGRGRGGGGVPSKLFSSSVFQPLRSQMQGGQNWILPKEINADRFFWHSHWLEIWKKPVMSPYGTELRERGYGLCITCILQSNKQLHESALYTCNCMHVYFIRVIWISLLGIVGMPLYREEAQGAIQGLDCTIRRIVTESCEAVSFQQLQAIPPSHYSRTYR